jgi:hypothetical protein
MEIFQKKIVIINLSQYDRGILRVVDVSVRQFLHAFLNFCETPTQLTEICNMPLLLSENRRESFNDRGHGGINSRKR